MNGTDAARSCNRCLVGVDSWRNQAQSWREISGYGLSGIQGILLPAKSKPSNSAEFRCLPPNLHLRALRIKR
jgi:hypothetical protein